MHFLLYLSGRRQCAPPLCPTRGTAPGSIMAEDRDELAEWTRMHVRVILTSTSTAPFPLALRPSTEEGRATNKTTFCITPNAIQPVY